MELSDLTSVDAASAELHRIAPQIDMVILNAGVLHPPPPPPPPQTHASARMHGRLLAGEKK